jgi:glutamate synthase (NADPH/NADH) small chain
LADANFSFAPILASSGPSSAFADGHRPLLRDDQRPLYPGEDNGQKVAIIGAGPSGISCAIYLRRLGYAVTLFEKRPIPGGLNSFGVAEYKMDQKTSLQELQLLFQMGCNLVTNTEIGRDIMPGSLRNEFDAIYIGAGLATSRKLLIPGENLPGVWDALSFIERIKSHEDSLTTANAVTVVIGGGNTAIDAAIHSRRLGTGEVLIAYRGEREDMGAYESEIRLAQSHGVQFKFNLTPTRILGHDRVNGIEFMPTKVKDKSIGPSRGTFVMSCDRVIQAIGQHKNRTWQECLDLRLNDNGTLQVNPATLETSQSFIFAGGDAINGGKEVVQAVADGKRAAWNIHLKFHPGAIPDDADRYWVSTIEEIAPQPLPSYELTL